MPGLSHTNHGRRCGLSVSYDQTTGSITRCQMRKSVFGCDSLLKLILHLSLCWRQFNRVDAAGFGPARLGCNRIGVIAGRFSPSRKTDGDGDHSVVRGTSWHGAGPGAQPSRLFCLHLQTSVSGWSIPSNGEYRADAASNRILIYRLAIYRRDADTSVSDG